MTDRQEQNWIDDARRGDQEAFAQLVHLYEKHEALYRAYPKSDAVMNRRMGKRLRQTEPAKAAAHYWKSFRLSHHPYDLGCYIRAMINVRKGDRSL